MVIGVEMTNLHFLSKVQTKVIMKNISFYIMTPFLGLQEGWHYSDTVCISCTVIVAVTTISITQNAQHV